MSVLRVQNDDFPDAAARHFGDATALCAARRYDGACYLLGYVVECCLKAIRLHDHAWRPASLNHDPQALIAARNQMAGRAFGHGLQALVTVAIGGTGGRYLPDIPPNASIYNWSSIRRYQPVDLDAEARATSWMHWATHVYETTIVQMTLDGVL